MKSATGFVLRRLALLLCLFIVYQATLLRASAQATTPPGATPSPNLSGPPLPAQLRAAHRVFVSNLGADPGVPGDPDASYNQFYADLQTWGRYQLVSAPAEADLVFQLRVAAPISGVDVVNGNGSSRRSLQLQLTILDPVTHVTLWAVQVPVGPAARKKTMERAQQQAVKNLTSKLKVLAGDTLSSQESSALTQSSVDHSLRNSIILTSALAGAALASGLILYHVYSVHKSVIPPPPTCISNPFFCGH